MNGKPVCLFYFTKLKHRAKRMRRRPTFAFAKHRKWIMGQSVTRGELFFTLFGTTYEMSFYLGERISVDNPGLKNTSIFARFF
jgi:hypothetical protein